MPRLRNLSPDRAESGPRPKTDSDPNCDMTNGTFCGDSAFFIHAENILGVVLWVLSIFRSLHLAGARASLQLHSAVTTAAEQLDPARMTIGTCASVRRHVRARTNSDFPHKQNKRYFCSLFSGRPGPELSSLLRSAATSPTTHWARFSPPLRTCHHIPHGRRTGQVRGRPGTTESSQGLTTAAGEPTRERASVISLRRQMPSAWPQVPDRH